jgi:hypothetical protein
MGRVPIVSPAFSSLDLGWAIVGHLSRHHEAEVLDVTDDLTGAIQVDIRLPARKKMRSLIAAAAHLRV